MEAELDMRAREVEAEKQDIERRLRRLLTRLPSVRAAGEPSPSPSPSPSRSATTTPPLAVEVASPVPCCQS